MKYELEPYHRDVPDEELLADLKRVATELGKDHVTIDEYNERGRFHSATPMRRFGSWFGATDKAGLRRTRNYNIPDEDLFTNLVELWASGGRQPRHDDLNPGNSRFGARTHENRFGTGRKALIAFVHWANEGELPPAPDESAKKAGTRTPRKINWRLRAKVLMKEARCRLCGRVAGDGVSFHVDHIKPWSKGGETVLENLQVLCNVCNIGKSNVEQKED